MVRRSGWFLLGSSAVTLSLGMWSMLAGCQGDETTSGSGNTGGGSTGSSMSTSGTAGGGQGGAGVGGDGVGGANPTGTGGMGGMGGGSSGLCDPTGTTPATIEKIVKPTANNGPPEIGLGVSVKLTGVIAMSQQFLVSQSKSSGSCLWGAFISSPNLPNNTTQPYSGTLIVSYGKPAVIPPGQTTAICPGTDGMPSGSAIPDDLKPGDVLDIIGKSASYIPSSGGNPVCDPTKGESSVPQYQISNVKCATKTGTAAVPTPYALTSDEVLKLAGQSDKDFYNAWGGVKVRLENVKPVPQMGQGDAGTTVVGAFGNITIEGSNLLVGDKLYYVKGSQDKCEKGPVFTDTMMTFTSIDGFAYQNYCTWGLQPNDKCADFSPMSGDCTAATDCSM